MNKRTGGISAAAWFYGQPGFHRPLALGDYIADRSEAACPMCGTYFECDCDGSDVSADEDCDR